MTAQEISLNLELWPRQLQAFQSQANEQLFGGATEGGKSHYARILLISACLAVPGLQCVLIRKKYDDILKNHVEGPTGFRAILSDLVNLKLVQITNDGVYFPKGSIIAFQHCFSGDTEIQTTEGMARLKDLVGKSGYVKVSQSFILRFENVRLTRKNAPLVSVQFDDGSSIKCTPDHRFLTESGFVEARDLQGFSCITNESQLSIQQLKSLKALKTLEAGILHLMALPGTVNRLSAISNIDSIRFVNGAELSTKALEHTEPVPGNVGEGFTVKRRKCVKIAPIPSEDVYCLTVPDLGLFPLANGVLVSNCQDERQFTSAQGVEKHLLVIDEATQISERLIRFFRTWVRMPKEMQAQLPVEWQKKLPGILYTANPIGPSVPFFRRNFVDALPNEEIKLVSGFRRQYLLSRYTDNLSVDKDAHVGRLEGLGDKALADALDLGKWDALTGEFYPEWDAERHVVKDFIPPQHWFRFRSFDWGTADPASVYWIAVSDGEPFQDNEGHKRWFPRGALIFYNEWYICDDGHSRLEDNHPDKGRRLSNKEMAEGIIHRSEFEHRNVPTLTDSKPFQDVGGDGPAKVFEALGVPLTQADTSRVAGWSQLRSRLIGEDFGYTDTDGKPIKLPLIYFCACCKYAQDYIPSLPRHPREGKGEDAAEHGEATHACDAVRYACMAHANLLVKDKIQPMQARIMKELAAQKPTIKKIAKGLGHGYFG